MPESSVGAFLTEPDGLFRFTISYPGPDDFPDLRGKSTSIFGYYFAVDDQRTTADGENTLLTLRKRKITGASDSWLTLKTFAGQYLLPTKVPAPSTLIRSMTQMQDGGDVGPLPPPGGSPTYPTYPPPSTGDKPPYEPPPMDPTGGYSAGGSGTTAVLPAGGPLLVIGAIIAALAGLGIVYLIVDRVERIVESPAATFPLLALSVALLAGVYAAFKKGKLA